MWSFLFALFEFIDGLVTGPFGTFDNFVKSFFEYVELEGEAGDARLCVLHGKTIKNKNHPQEAS